MVAMGSTTDRTLQDRAAGITRMIRALARDPGEWEPADLQHIRRMRQELANVETAAIHGMRAGGVTDSQLAQALGVTQQAVSKRWPGGGLYVGAAGRYRSNKGQQGGS